MKIFHDNPDDINEAAGILRNGGLVAVPTETVYGLAANAFDEEACRKIFKVKRRPLIDPLIVHIHDLQEAKRLADFNSAAEALAEAFWPGPLTLVLEKKRLIPGIVTANRKTAAIRMPRHPVMVRILEAAGVPLAAPSANRFGYISPTRVEHIPNALGDTIDYAVEGGPCKVGVESTIVDLCHPESPTLLRAGAITEDMLAGVLGREVASETQLYGRVAGREEGSGLPSPGLFEKHYSPRANLVLMKETGSLEVAGAGKTAVVHFRRIGNLPRVDPGAHFRLTEEGDLQEAAQNLYHVLLRLDREGYETIFVEPAPEEGIGLAINDRLRRAAGGGGK